MEHAGRGVGKGEGDGAEQWQCIELVVMYFLLASENVEKLMA